MMKPRLAATTYGFTLLEMLLVVFLMGMLAVAATAMVDNADEQQRFDITKSRLEQIRRAVIGDTSRTLNGEPDIHGFVADMGRLPNNIDELVQLGGQKAWGIQTLSGVVGVELWAGWRGPYVGMGGTSDFRDGWGNPDISGVEAYQGWKFTPPSDVLSVQSYGSDAADGGTDYAQDYPSGPIINAHDWQLSVSAVPFVLVFNKSPASDISPTTDRLKLRIYFFEDTAVEYEDSDGYFGLSGVAAVSGVSPVSVTISPASPLRMGRYAAVVVCSNENDYPVIDATPSNDKLFDGNCADPSTHAPHYFSIVPGMPLPITIPWNIQ